jgi:hypothetical protein
MISFRDIEREEEMDTMNYGDTCSYYLQAYRKCTPAKTYKYKKI